MSQNTCRGLFEFDRSKKISGQILAGVDEAGRGPLAGPVVAAAVIFRDETPLEWLNDSKKLTPLRREKLYLRIAGQSLLAIGTASEAEIDEINIYQASRLAMKRALLKLSRTPDKVLIDGNMKLDWPLRQESVVKGDQKSAAIAAASVIAKVYRDHVMAGLDRMYPGYLLKKHKGYPTKEHIRMIQQLGPSPIHRKSFSPVRDLIGAQR